ncbi:ribosomal-processing cysteine protease Prp [Dethiothermospora halolimnae]|uniref:ribosomal-processing cysteine protease Prp n=1 Tax=Dethiothermospora halolimnae TaxID=3114390 RepID=UPI003CCB743B
MTEIKILKSDAQSIVGYSLNGHTGYGVEGQDILCAAISTLSQTTLIALNEVCDIDEDKINYRIDEKTGFLSVIIPTNMDYQTMEKAQIVFRTMEVGIKSLIEVYPDYITLEYGEV